MGRLCSGPRLVGRIESWVRVSVSFQQKYPPGSVLRCPTAAKNGGYDQGGRGVGYLPSSPAYNVEPVTNTSSSSCANNGRRTPRWVLDARRRSLRLCFSHFANRTVDNTRPVCSEARYSSIIVFLLTPPAFDAPFKGGSRLNIATPFGMEKLWCGHPTVKKFWYVYSFWHNSRTWQTDAHTHRDKHRKTT